MPAMRVVFMGTPDFAVPILAELTVEGHDIAALYTQPPRKAGRGMTARPSPVQEFASEAGFPVFMPTSLKKLREQEIFISHKADIAVIAAYGLILPKPVLNAPRYGCLNVHASLLPRWRGAAPIQRAIMAGDEMTGVMIMRMEEGLDTGPVCLGARVLIGPDTTGGELHHDLSLKGAKLAAKALRMLVQNKLNFRPQPTRDVTYAAKLTNQDTRIDWRHTATEVHNVIRALSPYPGAWFEVLIAGKVERIKVLRTVVVPGKAEPGTLLDGNLTIACRENAIRLTQLQRAGKKPMPAAEFLRGFPLARGSVFA